MKISVGTYFTKKWCYSARSWFIHTAEACSGMNCELIASTDDSEECGVLIEEFKTSGLFSGVHHIQTSGILDDQKAYKEEAQHIIATIQQKAFSKARSLSSDYFWSIESDVIVPPNSLKVLIQALEFDDGYYSVGMVTYPNGQFLGGRGTQANPIAEDFTHEERKLTKELKEKIEKREKELKSLIEKKSEPTDEQKREWEDLDKKIKECPPIGNVFELQAKKWRKRGWMDSAYPAIGRGAILPTDWVGLGCTLLNKKALSLATFEGYDLRGTQDLFLCWNRWHQHGLKMCVIPHILCSHIKRKVDKDGKRTDEIEVHEAYHELSGEYEGHIRWRPKKYYDFN